ncbi:MAG: hypothetical protein MR550_01390 [Bacilli bacterium]|nr:hypothetical protein [Bacilli bacterium]
MELNSVMFILSLSQEYINRENVVSYEIIDDSINMVVKKDNNSKSLDNYTLFVIKKNGNHVSITKNSNNDSVYYDYLFYDILGRHFCEVYVDSNQTYMSELNYNIFDKKDDYSDAIKEFNIVTDNKKRR